MKRTAKRQNELFQDLNFFWSMTQAKLKEMIYYAGFDSNTVRHLSEARKHLLLAKKEINKIKTISHQPNNPNYAENQQNVD